VATLIAWLTLHHSGTALAVASLAISRLIVKEILMPLLTKDAILQADDLEYEELEVPEWGGTVRIRALSGKERDAYEASMRQQRGKEFIANLANIRAKLVVKCVVGEDGERLFTDQDAPAVGEKSAAALDRIFEVCARLSRLSDEDVDELAGKSADDQNGDSTSG
jgi:hypothetical protein